MTREQKQSELERYRAILLATLNYFLEHNEGTIVYDRMDSMTTYFQEQKTQIEKYYQQRKLDRLQQRLNSLTAGLHGTANLSFTNYIKIKTGYEIDIFENLQKRIDAIIVQTEIRNQKELSDVFMMLRQCQQSTIDRNVENKLKVLLANYSNQHPELDISAISKKEKIDPRNSSAE